MTPIQFFLSKIAEEAGEITQVAIKAAIYGLDSHHPKDPDTDNAALLTKEWADLEAALELLQQELGDAHPSLKPTAEMIAERKQKILQWAVPAIQAGQVILSQDTADAQADDPAPATQQTPAE